MNKDTAKTVLHWFGFLAAIGGAAYIAFIASGLSVGERIALAATTLGGLLVSLAKIFPMLDSAVDKLPMVIVLASLIAPASARAQQFGGCLAGGDVCLGPSASVTVGQFNLSTSKFTGGVIPGIGYGATYKPSEWYAAGVALYLSFQVGQGQPNQAVPSLMLSFANYVRLGVGLSIVEQDSGPTKKSWSLLFGLGSDFGGSPKYVKNQLETPTGGP